jgi:hypothetical protein
MLFALIIALCFSANAQIPQVIAHQGFYSDSLGNPKPDGDYTFTFRIYEAESGGSPVWTEIKDLPVKNGLFHTLLGDATPLTPTLDFNLAYWLGIKPGADPELSPRIPLSSVPYALIAETVPDSAVTTGKILDGAVTMEKINQSAATTGEVLKWNGSAWAPGNDVGAGATYSGIGGYNIPTTQTPAWDSIKIQAPAAGFLQATATATIYLTDATGCPCQYRGALYLTGDGYMTTYYTDVTLDVLQQRLVIPMTGGTEVPGPGTYNIEVRMFRVSGSGTATGYGNGTAIWTPVNATTAFPAKAAVGENATEKP